MTEFLNLISCMLDILSNDKIMTATEIATEIVNNSKYEPYRTKKITQRGASAMEQIRGEISSINEKDKRINLFQKAKNEKNTTVYMAKMKEENNFENIVSNAENSTKYTEYDLYPIVINWALKNELSAKRIDEKTSHSDFPNANYWLHPDLVALEKNNENDIGSENGNVNTICKKSTPKFNIHSYEVKRDLNVSNYRPSFFQTVSNSSWANYSWICASTISEKIYPDLKMLCNQFNIGLIIIDFALKTCTIKINANYTELDWGAMSRIEEVNTDFKTFTRKTLNYINFPSEDNFLDIGR